MDSLVDVKDLRAEHLLALIEGKALVLRVRGFFDSKTSEEISTKLINDPKKSYYSVVGNCSRVGMTQIEIKDENTFHQYYREALPSIQQLRESCSPLISPMDKFRLILDEQWGPGAHLENIGGKKHFVGVCRIMEEGVGLKIHTDKLLRFAPESLTIEDNLLTQLAMNIYLSLPAKGGELEVWEQQPTEAEYKKMTKELRGYSVRRSRVGAPSVVVRPEVGDLLLFNSQRFHAVRKAFGKPRVGVGAFVGYRGKDKPLTYWS